MTSISLVSSPRRLRPNPQQGSTFDVEPGTQTLGYAGGEEARIALEAQDAEGSNATPATTKIARGLRSSMRRFQQPKSILKYPRAPAPPPKTDVQSERQFSSDSEGAPPASQSHHTHGETWEGTTLVNHEPPPAPRPTLIQTGDPVPPQGQFAADYKKMSGEFYEQPLFSLTRLKFFLSTIHKLPWIAHDRITMDYYPGRGTRISTGLTDIASASSALSSPDFSQGRRRRPVSSWFLGGSHKNKSNRESLDLAASPDSIPIVSASGHTMQYSPWSGLRSVRSDATGTPGLTRGGLTPVSPALSQGRMRTTDAHSTMPNIMNIIPSPPPIIPIEAPSTVSSPATTTTTTTTTQSSITPTQSPSRTPYAPYAFWVPPTHTPVIPDPAVLGSHSPISTDTYDDEEETESEIDPRSIPQVATRTPITPPHQAGNVYVQGGGGVGIYAPSPAPIPVPAPRYQTPATPSQPSSSRPFAPYQQAPTQSSVDHRSEGSEQARARYVYVTSQRRPGPPDEDPPPVRLVNTPGRNRAYPDLDNFQLLNSPQPPYIPVQMHSIDGMHAHGAEGARYIDR